MCKKRIRAVFAIALVVLSAQVWAVDIQAFAGFGGKYKAGTWVPVTVKLKNQSHDSLRGTIATFDPTSNQTSQYQTPFSLAGSSEKQYTYYVLQNNPVEEIPIKLFPSTNVAGADKLQTASRNLAPVFQDNLLLVAAGPTNYALNFLEGQSIVLGQATPGGIAPTAAIETGLIDPTMLPDRPFGYDCIDLFVLPDFSPSTCDPKRLVALKMWVASGGTLVINGGANYQQLQNDFYADLMPIEITGATEVDSLAALTNTFGFPLEKGKTTVASGKLKSNTDVMVRENGVPLVASRRYGLGKVFFLAFDYAGFPVNGWDGQNRMWKSIILASSDRLPLASLANYANSAYTYANRQGRSPAANPRFNRSYQMHSTLVSGSNPIESLAGSVPSITMPSMEVIVLFLLGYLICLVPVNYFILSRKNRRELAWITTPIIIIVFTIGAYGIGFAMKGGNLLLKTATIIEAGANSKYASVSTYGGLFSPSRRTYDIELSDPYAVVSEPSMESNPYQRIDYKRPDLKFLMGETTSIPELPMDMWSMRTFRVESGCDLGGTIKSDLRLETQGNLRIIGSITNNTNYDLKDCKIIVMRRAKKIGNIAARSKVIIGITILEKTSTSAPGIPPVNLPFPVQSSSHTSHRDSDSLKDKLENELLSKLTSSNEIVLLGWLDKMSTEIKLKSGHGERQSANCVIFRLPDVTVRGGVK
jgi:hypothetical protein